MKKIVVLVDIDKTILKGTTVKFFAGRLFKKGLIDFKFFLRFFYWYVKYKFNFLSDFSSATEHALLQADEWSVEPIDCIMKESFEKDIVPRFYSEMSEKLKDHNAKGHEVVFVSSTLSPIVKLVVEYFGFGKIVATDVEIVDGHYTGGVTTPVCYGIQKKIRVLDLYKEEAIDFKSSYAYSDHLSDVPMLEMVGNPCVINPGRRLRSQANKRNWTILEAKNVKN